MSCLSKPQRFSVMRFNRSIWTRRKETRLRGRKRGSKRKVFCPSKSEKRLLWSRLRSRSRSKNKRGIKKRRGREKRLKSSLKLKLRSKSKKKYNKPNNLKSIRSK